MGASSSIYQQCLPGLKRSQCTKNKTTDLLVKKALQYCAVLSHLDFQDLSLSALAEAHPELEKIELELDGRWIPTDDDLKKLVLLTNLREVNFSGCDGITRIGVQSISYNLSQITTLILNGCVRLSDTFLQHIVRFQNLEHLELGGCLNISDKGVRVLSSLKKLTHLNLSMKTSSSKKSMSCDETTQQQQQQQQRITDHSLNQIRYYSNLKCLQLSGCQNISDCGISCLVTLHNLEHLDLSWTNVTEIGLKVIKCFPQLQSLDLSGCSITDISTPQILNKTSNLTQLNLSNVSSMTDKFLQDLIPFVKLQDLNVSHCPELTDDGLKCLTKFKSLASFEANFCREITGTCVSHLNELTTLQKLQMNQATNHNYDDLLKLIHLQHLEMGIPMIDEKQLLKLKNLKELSLLTLWLPKEMTHVTEFCILIEGIKVQFTVHK